MPDFCDGQEPYSPDLHCSSVKPSPVEVTVTSCLVVQSTWRPIRQPSQQRVVLAYSCSCCDEGGWEDKQKKPWGESLPIRMCSKRPTHFLEGPVEQRLFLTHPFYTHRLDQSEHSSLLTPLVTLTPSCVCLYDIVNY